MNYYNFEKLFNDFGVDYKPLNSRNYLSVSCPFCSDSKYKLGIHISGFAVCWSCGAHPIWTVIKHFTGQNWSDIQVQYKTELNARDIYLSKYSERDKPTILKLPEFTGPLNSRARKYLERRGFDSYELEELYDLKSTEHLGQYNFRIIIPIYFENQLVSYTSRDYTGKSNMRYFSCSHEKELISHKDILYGFDQVPGDHVIACEGPADKWKLGINSVATFGTGFKHNQVLLLASFNKITLLYDSGDNAKRKCDMLGDQLAGLGCEVDAIYLKEGDPGDLPRDEAESLVKEIMR